MPTMWDRLRTTQKDGGSQPDRRKAYGPWQPQKSSPYGYSISIKGGPTPSRPPRRDDDYIVAQQAQTSAPAVQAPRYPPQAGRDSYRDSSYGRPASSIYSQPSPAAATFAAQQLRDEVYNDVNDISPPSSPDVSISRNGHTSYDDGDVSPLEESGQPRFPMEQPPSGRPDQSRSTIPMMRRQRRKESEAALQALKEAKSKEQLKQPRPHGNDVRWDPRTGEPTTSGKGRPSQIDPHQFVEGLSRANAPTGAPQRSGQQPANPFGMRLKPVPRKSSGNPPEAELTARPEWRGASGRTARVAPVSDIHNVAPLNLPRKSSKRAARGSGVLSPVSSVGSETTSPLADRETLLSRDERRGQTNTTRSVVTSPVEAKSSTQSSYPSPPMSDGRPLPTSTQRQARRPEEVPASPAQAQSPQTLYPPQDKAIRRKPAAGHNPHISTSSSVYSRQDVAPAAGRSPAADDWEQPPSRFSVTTYAESPRPSVDEFAPPLPTPPRQFTESPKPLPGTSILDRKRPVLEGFQGKSRSFDGPDPIKISMDSPYSVAAAVKSRPAGPRPVPRDNPSTLSVISVSSADKDLPLAPPEQSARDRVAQLNAQLEALGNRRININHAIKQMTELMPTDNILASDAVIRKREGEKRKVENLKNELADVQREEYELGLKLHRAYKRLDRDAEFEPTTLWVRRVTGHD